MYQGLLNKVKRGQVFNHPHFGLHQVAFRRIRNSIPTSRSGCGASIVCGIPSVRAPCTGDRRSGPTWHPPSHSPAFRSQSRSARVASSQSCHVTKPAASATLCGSLSVGPSCRGSASKDRRAPGHRTYGAKARRVSRPLEGPVPGLHHGGADRVNQQCLHANSAAVSGATRNGPSFLGALLVCGRRGLRLMVAYTNAGTGLRYSCACVLSTTPSRSARVCRGSAWTRSFANRSWRHSSRPRWNCIRPRRPMSSRSVSDCINNAGKNVSGSETNRAGGAAVSSCRTGRSARGSEAGTALGDGYPKAATGTRRLRAFLP